MKYIVEKRDGTLVDFQIGKICNVIKKAFGSLHKEWDDSVIELLALRVTADFDAKREGNRINVEQIQDSVEKVLSESGYTEVSKAYILYRKQRENVRRLVSKMHEHSSLIASYLSNEGKQASWSNSKMISEISSDLIHRFWADEIFDEEIRHALKEKKFTICALDTLLMTEKTIRAKEPDTVSGLLDLIRQIGDTLRNDALQITIKEDGKLACKEEIVCFFPERTIRFTQKETKDICVKAEICQGGPKEIELAQRAASVRRQVLVQLAQAGFFQDEQCVRNAVTEISICMDPIPPFTKEEGFVYTRKKTIEGSDAFGSLDAEQEMIRPGQFDEIVYTVRFAEEADEKAKKILLDTLYRSYPFVDEFLIETNA